MKTPSFRKNGQEKTWNNLSLEDAFILDPVRPSQVARRRDRRIKGRVNQNHRCVRVRNGYLRVGVARGEGVFRRVLAAQLTILGLALDTIAQRSLSVPS